MHTTRSFLVVSTAVLVLLAFVAVSHAVSAGAPLLGLPADARAIGMGQTGAADDSDPSSIYYNPANAAGEPGAYLTGSRMNWPDDWFVSDLWAARGHAGVVWRDHDSDGARWGLDFSLAKLDYGESIVTDPSGTPLGTVHPTEKAASLAFAVALPTGSNSEMCAGVAVKRWWADYAPAEFTQDNIEVSPSAYAVDLGVTGVMRVDVGDWMVRSALGAAMVDAGPDFDAGEGKDPLPLRFNVGGSLRVESPLHRLGDAEVPLIALVTNVDATKPRDADFEWGMGGELAVAQILFVRSGVRMIHLDSRDDVMVPGWSVGLGAPISSFRFRADYGKGDYYYVSSMEHFGVTLGWVF